MLQALVIGLVAGIAAALLFVAPLGGTPLAIPLFALTGLPIAIAGVGWGLVAGAGAVVGGVALSYFLASLEGALVFALLFALPVAWTVAVAILPRPRPVGGWRSLGVILGNAAIAVVIGVVGVGIVIGYDPAALTADITSALADLAASANATSGTTAPSAADLRPFVALNVTLMPASIAVLALSLVVIDVYLAEKSVSVSDRMKRPHENLWTVSLPALLPLVLALAVVGSFIPGSIGHIAEVIAGALAAALAMVGLAVIHALTRGTATRATILSITYALLIPLSGLLILALTLLGSAETVLHLRAGRMSPRGPSPT